MIIILIYLRNMAFVSSNSYLVVFLQCGQHKISRPARPTTTGAVASTAAAVIASALASVAATKVTAAAATLGLGRVAAAAAATLGTTFAPRALRALRSLGR